jgi:hypothetical protein
MANSSMEKSILKPNPKSKSRKTIIAIIINIDYL